MRVKEEYVRAGYFWLPEKQENEVPGTLTTRDGGKIEITGLLDKNIVIPKNSFQRIIGHVEQDGLVTLEDCINIKSRTTFGGISQSTIYVRRVLNRHCMYPRNILQFIIFCC